MATSYPSTHSQKYYGKEGYFKIKEYTTRKSCNYLVNTIQRSPVAAYVNASQHLQNKFKSYCEC